MRLFNRHIKKLNQQVFKEGEYLFREGEAGHDAFRILEGCVEITLGQEDKKVVLAQFGPGAVVGEMGLMDHTLRSANAICLSQTVVEVMDVTDFSKGLIKNQDELVSYLESMFCNLREMNNRLRTASGIPNFKATNLKMKPLSNEGAQERVDGTSTEEPVFNLTLYSDSEEMHEQSALRERKIDILPLMIGRRREAAAIDVFHENELVIFDERPYSISREHCIIEEKNGDFFIQDLGSHTGTIVNGMRVNGNGTNTSLVQLKKGENTLVLGGPESAVRFLLKLEAAT